MSKIVGNRVSFKKDNCGNHEWAVGGKKIREMKSCIIRENGVNYEYPVKQDMVINFIHEHGHRYEACTTDFFIEIVVHGVKMNVSLRKFVKARHTNVYVMPEDVVTN